jgi:mannose-6-phosphate isomerase-like protein (cupin superfamily)
MTENIMKRVVTGHDSKGKSIFISDGTPPKQITHKGNGLRLDAIWATDDVPVVPAPVADPTLAARKYFPDAGGTRFIMVHFAPESTAQEAAARGVDMNAASQEFFANFPGLADLMEPEHAGMHTSQTVDYGVILSGEVELELDDGKVQLLKPGDCFIQNGTRHAWRNPGTVECVAAVVVVGARRK